MICNELKYEQRKKSGKNREDNSTSKKIEITEEPDFHKMNSIICQENPSFSRYITPQAKNIAVRTEFRQSQNFLLPPLSPKNVRKKTLVLDLDETLVHSAFQPVDNVDIILSVEIEGTIFSVYVLMRPGVEELLKRASRNYEIVIYTASLSKYAAPLMNIIDPRRHTSHKLFREHCTNISNTYVKDLTQLGRDLKNVVIVDNSPASYSFQPENALPVSTWTEDITDQKLFELIPILDYLATFEDVRAGLSKFVLDGEVLFSEDLIQSSATISNTPPKINTWIYTELYQKKTSQLSKATSSCNSTVKEDESYHHFLRKSGSTVRPQSNQSSIPKKNPSRYLPLRPCTPCIHSKKAIALKNIKKREIGSPKNVKSGEIFKSESPESSKAEVQNKISKFIKNGKLKRTIKMGKVNENSRPQGSAKQIDERVLSPSGEQKVFEQSAQTIKMRSEKLCRLYTNLLSKNKEYARVISDSKEEQVQLRTSKFYCEQTKNRNENKETRVKENN